MGKYCLFTSQGISEHHYQIQRFTKDIRDEIGDKLNLRRRTEDEIIDYVFERTREFKKCEWSIEKCVELERQFEAGERDAVKTVILRDKYAIKGKHYPDDKSKYWIVPKKIESMVHAGDFVYVNTKYGKGIVLVEDVLLLKECDVKPERRVNSVIKNPELMEKAKYYYYTMNPETARKRQEAFKLTYIVTRNNDEAFPYALLDKRYKLIQPLEYLKDARKLYENEVKEGCVELKRDLSYTNTELPEDPEKARKNSYGLYPAKYCRQSGLPLLSPNNYKEFSDTYISKTRCKEMGQPVKEGEEPAAFYRVKHGYCGFYKREIEKGPEGPSV